MDVMYTGGYRLKILVTSMKKQGGLTQEMVRKRLAQVIDPELGINIVELGLVYDIRLGTQNSKLKNDSLQLMTHELKPKIAQRQAKIYIQMTLTTPGCPLAGMFDQLVREGLDGLPGIDSKDDVELELTFDPPWTPDMMGEEARAMLGI